MNQLLTDAIFLRGMERFFIEGILFIVLLKGFKLLREKPTSPSHLQFKSKFLTIIFSSKLPGLTIIVLCLVGIFIAFFSGGAEDSKGGVIKRIKYKGTPYDSASTNIAKAFYLELCKEENIPTLLPIDKQGLEQLTQKFAHYYPNLNEQELLQQVKEGFPDKLDSNRANRLLHTFLSGIAEKYRKKNVDLFAAELLNGASECETISINNQSLLILIDYGLTKSLYEWNKTVCQIALSKNISAEENNTRRKALLTSIDAYSLKNNLPYSSNNLWNDSLQYSSIISFWAGMFIIAHEYGHLVNNDNDKDDKKLTSRQKYQLEVSADSIAFEMIMTGNYLDAKESEKKVAQDFKMAGILYAISMLELVDMRTAAMENKSNDFYLSGRRGNLFINMDRNYTIRNYPLTNAYSNTLSYIEAALHTKTESTSDSSKVLLDKYQKLSNIERFGLIYTCCKENNKKILQIIIKRDPQFCKNFAVNLIGQAKLTSGHKVSALGADWMPGENLTCSKAFKIAVNIDQQFFKVFKKHVIQDYRTIHNALIVNLRESLQYFKSTGYPSAFNFINSQIQEIDTFNKTLKETG